MSTYEEWLASISIIEKVIPIDFSDVIKPQPMTSEQFEEYRSWSLGWYHECLKSRRFESNPFDGTWIFDVDYTIPTPTKEQKKRKRKEKEQPVINYPTFNPEAKKDGAIKPSMLRTFPDGINVVFTPKSMILHYQMNNKKVTICKKKIERGASDEEKFDEMYSVCGQCSSGVE